MAETIALLNKAAEKDGWLSRTDIKRDKDAHMMLHFEVEFMDKQIEWLEDAWLIKRREVCYERNLNGTTVRDRRS